MISENNKIHQEPTLKEKTAKGLFWGGISNGIQQILGVIIGIIFLKELTPDDYGMFGMLAIFTAVANTLQESGFTAALTNRNFNKNDYNAVFWFNVFTSIIIYVILYFSAPLISAFFKQPDLIPLSRVFFLSFIGSSLGIAHNAVLFKKMMVKERAKIDIISTLLAGSIGVFLAIKGFGYWALAYQTLSYNFIGTLLKWYFSPWKPQFFMDFTPIKEMFGFSSKLMISSIITQIHANIFSVLLGKFQTKADVGYFSQGAKWASMGGQFINGMVMSIAQPTIVQLNKDEKRQVQVFRKILRFIAFLSFPMLLGLAFISRDFISVLNSDWLPSVPILQIMCIWNTVAPISLLYTQIVVSLGDSNFYFFITFVYAFIQIAAAIVGLCFSIYWMAFSIAFVAFIFIFIWHIHVSNLLPIYLKDVIKDILPYLLITLGVIAITYLLTFSIKILILKLFLKIFIFIVLYIFILKMCKSAIFKESMDFLLKKVV